MKSIFAAAVLFAYGCALDAAPIPVSGGGSATCSIFPGLYGEYFVGFTSADNSIAMNFHSSYLYGACDLANGYRDVHGSGRHETHGLATIDDISSWRFDFLVSPYGGGYLTLFDQGTGELLVSRDLIGYPTIKSRVSYTSSGSVAYTEGSLRISAVPEPGTWLVGVVIGLYVLCIKARRRVLKDDAGN